MFSLIHGGQCQRHRPCFQTNGITLRQSSNQASAGKSTWTVNWQAQTRAWDRHRKALRKLTLVDSLEVAAADISEEPLTNSASLMSHELRQKFLPIINKMPWPISA